MTPFPRVLRVLVVCGALLVGAPLAQAGISYDEAIDGDLSNSPSAPTALVFTTGGNTITGTVSAPSDIRDYITFTVPPGQFITALRLIEYTDVDFGGDGDTGFHMIDNGSTSIIPTMANGTNLMGGDHVDTEPSGTDLLPSLATGGMANGSGFGLPLAPGTYTYNMQQTGIENTRYTVRFVLSAPGVPAASSVGLWILGGLVLVGGFFLIRKRRPAVAA